MGLMIAVLMTACSDRNALAPVEEHPWHAFNRNASQYTVVRGDTLYSIAFHYDSDYRTMAAYNGLKSPYTLKIGQVLRLMPQRQRIQKARAMPRAPLRSTPILRAKPPLLSRLRYPHPANGTWTWPARGRVIANYAPQRGMKGIMIAGQKGDHIYAASSGVVAYSGNGLAGYGNLIIIKHNNQFLTAYGNNLKNSVHEGQRIQKGQVIAEMGIVERHYWGVHFEIRQFGKPVNPLIYIKRNT